MRDDSSETERAPFLHVVFRSVTNQPFHICSNGTPIFTYMVQDNIVVELHGTSDDPTRDMSTAVVFVAVGPNGKTGVYETGHEFLREQERY